jgi:prepilin-type N-terminal cleavage/methylation domain-containing protein
MDENKNFNNNGFTIIELIVVFSVIAVLSTVGIASFVSFSRAEELQTATNDYINTLNLAKARALSQVKPVGCQGALSGYRVDLVSNQKYALFVVCGGDIEMTHVDLSKNISISNWTTSGARSVFFPIISSGFFGNGNVQMAAYGLYKCIVIDSKAPDGQIIKVSNIACP